MNKNELYKYLKEDILNCLGKDLNSNELIDFKKKYSITCSDKNGDRYFICKNDFINFQNRNQRKQRIEDFHIQNNNSWLPFDIKPNSRLEDLINILGVPDIIDYDFNVLKYYDLLVMISVEDALNPKSQIKTITFTKSLNNKPSENTLKEINDYWKDKISKSINVNFGNNSKWIVIETNKYSSILSLFKIKENSTANWKEAFKISSFKENGLFVFKVKNYIIVNGWALPSIERNKSFYETLSKEFGNISYFENHLKTPFSWVKLMNGKIIRGYKSEYFITVLDIGIETSIEKNLNITSKSNELLKIEEEYISDQDIKTNYRKYMSEMVLKIADDWCFNPTNIKKEEVNGEVHINKNYRQQ